MDIGRAMSYIFEDERWVTKVLIGGLLIWIPVFGQFVVLGYSLQTAQNVARGVERPLPEWGNYGDLFMRGLYAFIIAIVYMLPLFLIAGIFGCVMGGFASAMENGNDPSALLVGANCLFVPIILIAEVLFGMAAYGGILRYLATDQLSEAFKFGEVISMVRNNVGMFLMFILLMIIANLIGGLGAIACGVGALFTTFMGIVMIGHGLGQMLSKLFPTDRGFTPPSMDYSPPTTQL